eukprot:TRINITY_DN1415_c1_g1_i1.p1 TRINITY_DN1415_c1_g1~~TRINITY_DN1415_c1_g1_i1.p1  ORF type:complete len:370 (+),score=56.20 TRINITY_DN1415_c1_g1_i1:62-1171(+)
MSVLIQQSRIRDSYRGGPDLLNEAEGGDLPGHFWDGLEGSSRGSSLSPPGPTGKDVQKSDSFNEELGFDTAEPIWEYLKPGSDSKWSEVFSWDELTEWIDSGIGGFCEDLKVRSATLQVTGTFEKIQSKEIVISHPQPTGVNPNAAPWQPGMAFNHNVRGHHQPPQHQHQHQHQQHQHQHQQQQQIHQVHHHQQQQQQPQQQPSQQQILDWYPPHHWSAPPPPLAPAPLSTEVQDSVVVEELHAAFLASDLRNTQLDLFLIASQLKELPTPDQVTLYLQNLSTHPAMEVFAHRYIEERWGCLRQSNELIVPAGQEEDLNTHQHDRPHNGRRVRRKWHKAPSGASQGNVHFGGPSHVHAHNKNLGLLHVH